MSSRIRSIPPVLYHWTSASLLPSILEKGLQPYLPKARGGHNRHKSVVFLQDETEFDFASTYFNMPSDPVRLAIDTTQLNASWSPDLAAWNDWPGDPEQDFDLTPEELDANGTLEGTLERPSAHDTLRYTGCVCYHGHISVSAILESVLVSPPDYISVS